MTWIRPTQPRNYQDVQYAELRQQIEQRFNDVHDELSEAYYNKQPFRTFGVLTKEQFDTLHGLIFDLLFVKFCNENQKRTQPYDENEFRYYKDSRNRTVDKLPPILTRIQQLKSQGYTLADLE